MVPARPFASPVRFDQLDREITAIAGHGRAVHGKERKHSSCRSVFEAGAQSREKVAGCTRSAAAQTGGNEWY